MIYVLTHDVKEGLEGFGSGVDLNRGVGDTFVLEFVSEERTRGQPE
jgi:hypothetical protein